MNSLHTCRWAKKMHWKLLLPALLAITVSIPVRLGAEEPKRVQPPEWSQDVLDAFFEDAREHLVGERPTSTAAAPATVDQQAATPESPTLEFAWSRIVDADTLMAETKRINNQLANSLRRSATFQGGGNLQCRRDFGMLAVLFGVIAEFDGEVRWKAAAQAMKARCLKSSANCKVASAQAFADAQATREVLDELLKGQAPAEESKIDGEDQLADRTLLMQAMEVSLQGRLGPNLANKREFRRRTQAVTEQAQLLAVLAKVIEQEGYDYTDDEDFLAEARRLRAAASELSQAAKDKNYESARKAAGQIGQSCSSCHEGYRG